MASFIKSNGPLLDIGARTAILKNYIKSDINYYAIDIDESIIIYLWKKGINCKLANAEHIPYDGGFFNTIVMGEVLEHISNMGLVLDEIYRVLKNKGEFIITVPNGELKTRLYLAFKRFYKIPFIKKCEKRSPKIGGHIHMFNLRHLQLLMKTYNFKIVKYANSMKDEYIIIRCVKNV